MPIILSLLTLQYLNLLDIQYTWVHNILLNILLLLFSNCLFHLGLSLVLLVFWDS